MFTLDKIEEHLFKEVMKLPKDTPLVGDDLTRYQLIALAQKHAKGLTVALMGIKHPEVGDTVLKLVDK